MDSDLGHLSRREAIKARLRSRGTSLAQLGRDINRSASTVSSVLAGARSRVVEEALAAQLETTVEELFPERKHEKGVRRNE